MNGEGVGREDGTVFDMLLACRVYRALAVMGLRPLVASEADCPRGGDDVVGTVEVSKIERQFGVVLQRASRLKLCGMEQALSRTYPTGP